MKSVNAGELGKQHGMEQLGFWNKLVAHPSYDEFWRDQALDKISGCAAAKSASHAGAQSLGPGRHLRRDCSL